MRFKLKDGTHSIRHVIRATVHATVKQPKAVLKYAAMRVLDMDGDLTELLDSVYSLEVRLPVLLRNHGDGTLTQILENASRSAWRLRFKSSEGAQALQDAFEECPDPTEVALEEVDWVEKHIEPAWDNTWGLDHLTADEMA
tara:strand:- start:550 stop:972 length:423 start_codon:yes stop_codon:yes gene_type:complete